MLILIKAGGKERPFNFGWRAIKEVQQEAIADPEQRLLSCIHKGFKYGAMIQKQEVDFTPEDVINWTDQDLKMYKKVSQSIVDEFAEFNEDHKEEEEGK